MRQGYFRIIFWLSCCLVALTGCKLSGSAFVGKWEDTSLPESYIEPKNRSWLTIAGLYRGIFGAGGG
jgi:hypothetical protein